MNFINMPGGSSSRDDCHLCHIHDHNHPSSLLRTTTLRDNSSPPRPRRHSRSGSIDKHYRNHHHSDHNHHHISHNNHHHGGGVHHHHDRERHHSRAGRVPSALARLSEHHSSHSLPASRSNTLNLYPEQVSVLPDGGHRYLGGDRACSVRSLELTSPRHAPDNRSHHSLQQTTSMHKNGHIHASPDILTNSMPALRSHGSHLSLNVASGLATSQDPPTADFFMPVNRLPFKDDSRKHRFNLQTVMLIGCYTLLFVMAIIIGVVLCHQNGWLGFGSPATLSASDIGLNEPGINTALGSVRSGTNRGKNNRPGTNHDRGNKLDRLKDGTENTPLVPVHNVVQLRNPDAANVNVAGVFGTTGSGDGSRPRSITGSVPGNRPIQQPSDIKPDPSSTSGNNNFHVNPIPNGHNHHNQINNLGNGGSGTPFTNNMNNNNNFLNNGNSFTNPNSFQNQGNLHLAGTVGVPLLPTTHIGTKIPVPALISPNTANTNLGNLGNHGQSNLPPPDTIHVHETIFLSSPPVSQNNNPFNTFVSNLQPNIEPTNRNIQITNQHQNVPNIFPGNNNNFNNQPLPTTFANQPPVVNFSASGSQHTSQVQFVPKTPSQIPTQHFTINPILPPSQPPIQHQVKIPNQNSQSIPKNVNLAQQTVFISDNVRPPVIVTPQNNPINTGSPIVKQGNNLQQIPAKQPVISFPPPFIVRKTEKNTPTQQSDIHLTNQNRNPQLVPNTRVQSNLNTNFRLPDESSVQSSSSVLDQSNSNPQLKLVKNPNNQNNKQKTNNRQVNQIHLEKMKMLKEILDAEGSGKLLQDLITLKNNQNSLTAISQHLSEATTKHGPSPSINSPPPQRNIASIVSPAILKHKNRLSTSESPIVSASNQAQLRNQNAVSVGAGKTSNTRVNPITKPQLKDPAAPKSKSNIQMVRELLASLVNSPEVQEILSSRNRQSVSNAPVTGRGIASSTQNKGEEMRAILLRALAKEIPDGQSLQRLRLHGPQPSINRQADSSGQRVLRRGEKAAKITRAQQLGHFNTTVQPRRRVIPSRRLLSRIGAAESKKQNRQPKQLTSVEHQSVRPPTSRRTSRGRETPSPNFTLNVKSSGGSKDNTRSSSTQKKKVTESVDMRKGAVEGEIIRHWRHMDNAGTMSQGTVRKDGSFAFTNCRPAEMC